MASKSKRKLHKKKSIAKLQDKLNTDGTLQRTVTNRAISSDKICPMKIVVFLDHDNHWYLSKKSLLCHQYHPPLDSKATLSSEKDLSLTDKKLVSILFSFMWFLYILIMQINFVSVFLTSTSGQHPLWSQCPPKRDFRCFKGKKWLRWWNLFTENSIQYKWEM